MKLLEVFVVLYSLALFVVAELSNETTEFSITKLIENAANLTVIKQNVSQVNNYNRTVEKKSRSSLINDDNAKSSIAMRIQPPSRNKTKRPLQDSSNSKKLEWISKPLREGLTDFKVRSLSNAQCNFQSDVYDMHLKNQTLWAIRMTESSQKEPLGIIGGNNYQMGNFEECIKTEAFGIKGKYCLANFKYSLTQEQWLRFQKMVPPSDFHDINHEESVWQSLVRLKKDPVRIDRQSLFWGFCMPAACTSEDLEFSLNQTLLPRFLEYNLDLNVTVDPIYCHTKDRMPFTKGFYITISGMALLLLVNILSTMYDGYEYLQGRYKHVLSGWREVIGTFSIWRNIYNLGIYNKNSQVKIVNGMKVLMMVLIIYGHTLLYILGYPQFNPASLEEVYRRGADIALVNTNIVDVFFTISGFLTFYYGYYPMKIGGMFYLILSIVFRYLRLMPVFAIVIAYVIFVLPYTSDGPIWNARIGIESENCYKNWWLDILLLNNFINVDEQCIIISWYITTDMLLCIVASILTYLMIKKPKFGLLVTFSILILSVMITFSVTYFNRYNGLMKLYMTLLENPRKSIEFKELYTALYARAGPYLVGFLTGYLTIKLQEIKFKFSTKTLLIGCTLVIIIGEGSQYYGVLFYQFERPYYLLENALYSCLHRILFACLFSWFLLAYLTTGFGILDSYINHRVHTILGRVTYSVFLMNTLSLITLTASLRTPVYYSYKMIMFIVFGDIVTTYVLGILFYLYAEAPICGISKLLQKTLARIFEKEIEKAKFDAKVHENGGISELKKVKCEI